MTIYKKMADVRCELQNTKMSKSGKNTFAGYDYFELSDFLPTINELCKKHGLLPVVSFDKEQAMMIIYNAEKPEEQLIFTSPMADVNLKGCHAIQNVGAAETYSRRYLYMTAFEIVEHDALDSTQGKDSPKNSPAKPQSKPAAKFVCSNCKKPFMDAKAANGTLYTAEQWYKAAEKKYGVAYCAECGKEVTNA
jgi:hypothetical protein